MGLFPGVYPSAVLHYRCHVAELRAMAHAWERGDFRQLASKFHPWQSDFADWIQSEKKKCMESRDKMLNEMGFLRNPPSKPEQNDGDSMDRVFHLFRHSRREGHVDTGKSAGTVTNLCRPLLC